MTLAAPTGEAFGQVHVDHAKPLTVCEALRNLKTMNGKIVAVRGTFHFTHQHGGWILDTEKNVGPCSKMPRKARIWWSAIWLNSANNPSLDDGPVNFKEEPPTYGDLIKISDDLNTGHVDHGLVVTLVGEIRTKKNLVIVRAPSGRGDTMGNGYGVGGAFAAVLIVKTARDVKPSDAKTPDPNR
jgi:hypothetical protein